MSLHLMKTCTSDCCFHQLYYLPMFCYRKHEEYVELNGKFHHEACSRCHDCQIEVDHNTMLVFHNGVANCRTCLLKKKDQQKRQNILELPKSLEDSKKLADECYICRNPIVIGEVCVKLTFEMNLSLGLANYA